MGEENSPMGRQKTTSSWTRPTHIIILITLENDLNNEGELRGKQIWSAGHKKTKAGRGLGGEGAARREQAAGQNKARCLAQKVKRPIVPCRNKVSEVIREKGEEGNIISKKLRQRERGVGRSFPTT